MHFSEFIAVRAREMTQFLTRSAHASKCASSWMVGWRRSWRYRNADSQPEKQSWLKRRPRVTKESVMAGGTFGVRTGATNTAQDIARSFASSVTLTPTNDKRRLRLNRSVAGSELVRFPATHSTSLRPQGWRIAQGRNVAARDASIIRAHYVLRLATRWFGILMWQRCGRFVPSRAYRVREHLDPIASGEGGIRTLRGALDKSSSETRPCTPTPGNYARNDSDRSLRQCP
jgi:hypothetical protein